MKANQLADACEKAANAFDELGYTAQFNTIADSVNLWGGGTGIGISPRKFGQSLRQRAAALRRTSSQGQRP